MEFVPEAALNRSVNLESLLAPAIVVVLHTAYTSRWSVLHAALFHSPTTALTFSRTALFAGFVGALALSGCDATDPGASTADARSTESYIVVFKDDVANARGLAQRLSNGNASHVYENSIKGFAAPFSPQAAAALARNPNVAYVEKDQVAVLAPPPGKGPGDGTGGGGGQSIPYGITRVNGGVASTGRACVIDSGIDLDHPDLNVDVAASRSFLGGKDATDPDDYNGHGTHVAGTVGAIDNDTGVIGVAAGATVVSVRVLDRRGSGSYSGVIAGVDYVAQRGASLCAVANMSLGGPVSEALDAAVLAAGRTGVKMVLAAGNESDDANNHSPARAGGVSKSDNVYAISAMNSGDNWASFSNFGSAVEYAAPGVGIESTWKSGGYNTISGTSMAAPHAAGVMLLGSFRTDGTVNNDPDGTPDPIIVN